MADPTDAMRQLRIMAGWDGEGDPPAVMIGADGTVWRGDQGPGSEVKAEGSYDADGEIVIDAVWVRFLPTGVRVEHNPPPFYPLDLAMTMTVLDSPPTEES